MTTDDVADNLLVDGPASARAIVALAHGAGAPMDHPFLEGVAHGLAEAELAVVRFEFPYMAARRRTGKRKPPDRAPVLESAWRAVVERLADAPCLVVGGKSMGGRFASVIADDVGADGLVCLGYPFHPPGKPDRLRTEHLRTLRTPALFLQGERDALGSREEVAGYELSDAIRVHWLADGDHSFAPRKSSGRTAEQNLGEAIERLVEFVDERVTAQRSR